MARHLDLLLLTRDDVRRPNTSALRGDARDSTEHHAYNLSQAALGPHQDVAT